MRRLILDASVIVKWLAPEPEAEHDAAAALQILEALRGERVTVCQPAHWLVEVAAVAARIHPETAWAKVEALQALELPTIDSPAVLRTACELAIGLQHHLFDTLYHAVALHWPESVLVTSDRRYFDKAESIGAISMLAGFDV